MEQLFEHHAILIDPAKRNIRYVTQKELQTIGNMVDEFAHLDGIRVGKLAQLMVTFFTDFKGFVAEYCGMPSFGGVDCHVFADYACQDKHPLTDFIMLHDHGPERVYGPLVMFRALPTTNGASPDCVLFFERIRRLDARITWLCPNADTRYYCEFFMAKGNTSAGAVLKFWPVEQGRVVDDKNKQLLMLSALDLQVIPKTVSSLMFAAVTPSNLRFVRTLAARAIRLLAQAKEVREDQIIELSSLT